MKKKSDVSSYSAIYFQKGVFNLKVVVENI